MPAVFGPDAPALCLDHAAGDGQAQAETVAARPGGAETGKRTEDGLQLVFRHTRTLILDPQQPMIAFLPASEANQPAVRRMALFITA